MLNGVAFIDDGKNQGDTRKIEKFPFFDRSDELTEIKTNLLEANEREALLINLRSLIKFALVDETLINKEMTRIIDTSFADSLLAKNSSLRSVELEKYLEELLTRRIGSKALKSLKEHLEAIRGHEEIPLFEILASDLDAGTDADDCLYLRSGNDFYSQLFKMPESAGDVEGDSFIA